MAHVTVKEAREAYYSHSGQASSRVRSLTLGGIAAVWLLREGEIALPPVLAVALGSLLAVLVADVLQYACLAHAWRKAMTKDGAAPDDAQSSAGPNINALGERLFWGKIAAGALSGFFLLVGLLSRLK